MGASNNSSFALTTLDNFKDSAIETPDASKQYIDVTGEVGATKPTWGSFAALQSDGHVYLTTGMDNDGTLSKLLADKTFQSISQFHRMGERTAGAFLAVDTQGKLHLYEAGEISQGDHILHSQWAEKTSLIADVSNDKNWKYVAGAPDIGNTGMYGNQSFFGITSEGELYEFFNTSDFNVPGSGSYVRRQLLSDKKWKAVTAGYDGTWSCPSDYQEKYGTAWMGAITATGELYEAAATVSQSWYGFQEVAGYVQQKKVDTSPNASLINVKYQPYGVCGIERVVQDSQGYLHQLRNGSIIKSTNTYAAFTIAIQNGSGSRYTPMLTTVPGVPSVISIKPPATTIACAPQTGSDPAASAWQTATLLTGMLSFGLAGYLLVLQRRVRRL